MVRGIILMRGKVPYRRSTKRIRYESVPAHEVD